MENDDGHPLRVGLSSQAMEPQASPPKASIPDAEPLYCSFCGKSQFDVMWLVGSSREPAFICETCTDIACEVIEEKRLEAKIAKAIEARSGETERLDPQGESAVAKPFAQKEPS